jgi:hypothetical protein
MCDKYLHEASTHLLVFSVEEVKLLTARQVMRPQVKFKHLIDNSDAPFVPRLTDKPHALKPLSILVEYDDKEQDHKELPPFPFPTFLNFVRFMLTCVV